MSFNNKVSLLHFFSFFLLLQHVAIYLFFSLFPFWQGNSSRSSSSSSSSLFLFSISRALPDACSYLASYRQLLLCVQLELASLFPTKGNFFNLASAAAAAAAAAAVYSFRSSSFYCLGRCCLLFFHPFVCLPVCLWAKVLHRFVRSILIEHVSDVAAAR